MNLVLPVLLTQVSNVRLLSPVIEENNNFYWMDFLLLVDTFVPIDQSIEVLGLLDYFTYISFMLDHWQDRNREKI